MNKRTMKKGLAIVLALVMVFAMTATAFADTNNNITVTVRFDTRSYDLSAKMLKSDAQTLVSNNPVVEYTVSVPAGSTALAAVQKAAADHGFDLQASDIHFVTYHKDQEYQTEAVDAANGEYNLLIPESDFQSMGTLGERARVMIESGTNLWHSTNATLYLKHEANASTLKALAAGGKLYIKSKEEAKKQIILIL